MCFIIGFNNKYTFIFIYGEIFRKITENSFKRIIYLIKYWIEIFLWLICKIIVYSGKNFIFYICFTFDIGRFGINIYFFFTWLTIPHLKTFSCSWVCKWDLLNCYFFNFPNCYKSVGYLLRDRCWLVHSCIYYSVTFLKLIVGQLRICSLNVFQ